MRSRDWVSAGFTVSAIAVSVFLIGGAFRWTQALVAVLVIGALAAQLPARRALARRSPLVIALLVAAGLTLVSLIPLPSEIREALDPVGSAFRDDGTALLGLSPWPGLARDASGALRGLAFMFIALGIAVPSLRFAVTERGRFMVLAAVGLICGITALVVGVHQLLGLTRLYGLYEIDEARPNVLGPLLNENHLGELMALGTCVALGLVMYRRQQSWMRVGWMLVVIGCGAVTAASYSRGSIIAMPIGAAITCGTMLVQRFGTTEPARKRRRAFTSRTLPIGIVSVCVIVVVVYSSAGRVSDKLGRTSLADLRNPHSKFMAWKSTSTLIEESPWVGVGRGGFEPSLTRVHPSSGIATFAFAENEYIQAVVDWGIPGGLLLGLVLIWFAAVAVRRWRDGPLIAGALGGLAAIAVQSNVDFGMELLGVAAPVVAVAATVVYSPLREERSVRLRRVRLLRVGHILAVAAGAVLLLTRLTTTIEEDHVSLATHHTIADVTSELDRHPMDYLGYAVAAQELSRSGDPRSIRLLNHAMRLHPTHPDLHRIAARLLIRSGHGDQASIEYAAALTSSTDPQRLIAEVVANLTPAQAAAAIPVDSPDPVAVLKTLQENKHDDVATLWLARVLQQHPKDVGACNLMYELSLRRGDLNGAEIAGRSCMELMPDRQTRLGLAKVLMTKQGYTEVVRLLHDVDGWTGLVEERTQGWLMLCDAYVALERWSEASQCLHRLDASGSFPIDNRSEVTRRLDQLEQQKRERDQRSISTDPGPTNRAPAPKSL